MIANHIASDCLLFAGVAVAMLSSLGMMLMPGAYAKIHYLGPISTVGAGLIALAAIVRDGFNQTTGKTVLLAIILGISGAVLSQATARAAKIRAEAGWDEEAPSGEELTR